MMLQYFKNQIHVKKINMFLNVSSTWSNVIANYRVDIPYRVQENLLQNWYKNIDTIHFL